MLQFRKLGSSRLAGCVHENSERGWLNVRSDRVEACASSLRPLSCCLSPTTSAWRNTPFCSLIPLPCFASALSFTITFIELLVPLVSPVLLLLFLSSSSSPLPHPPALPLLIPLIILLLLLLLLLLYLLLLPVLLLLLLLPLLLPLLLLHFAMTYCIYCCPTLASSCAFC